MEAFSFILSNGFVRWDLDLSERLVELERGEDEDKVDRIEDAEEDADDTEPESDPECDGLWEAMARWS